MFEPLFPAALMLIGEKGMGGTGPELWDVHIQFFVCIGDGNYITRAR